jgi:hypothetical protein
MHAAEILFVLPCNEEGHRQHLNSGHSMENSCTLDLYTAMFLAGHRHQVKYQRQSFPASGSSNQHAKELRQIVASHDRCFTIVIMIWQGIAKVREWQPAQKSAKIYLFQMSETLFQLRQNSRTHFEDIHGHY